jgi:hypothetical protein
LEVSVFFSEVFYLIVGVPVTFMSWIIFGFIQKQRFQKKTQILNENLAKINKKWSQERDEIVDLSHQEKFNFITQCFILAISASLFSWLGFIMSTIAWVSFFMVKSRQELKILNSDLSKQKDLPLSEVDKFFHNWT